MNKFELAALFGSDLPKATSPQDRRLREAMLPKCHCGNTAQKGKTECSRCSNETLDRRFAEARIDVASRALMDALHAAGVVDYSLITEAICELIDAKIGAAK